MKNTWQDALNIELTKRVPVKQSKLLAQKYAALFPESYCQHRSASEAADAILYLEKLSEKHPLEAGLSAYPNNPAFPFRLSLFQLAKPVPLSEAIPLLENMGLFVDSEMTFQLTLEDGQIASVSYFDVATKDGVKMDFEKIKPLFRDALLAVREGRAENDGFNRLVLAAELSFREIILLRAYAKYLHQARFRFSQSYIEKACAAHPDVTRNLVQLFLLRHAEKQNSTTAQAIEKTEKALQEGLDAVTSLDEDRILRRFWQLINATLRTNWLQKTEEGDFKPWLCFKLDSANVPELPLPRPLFEIFVYSPRFEAIHLRSAKVARGGIRWSDRREDFRTEVLGLMKAQRVKNAVIVPSGAKGGFVLKALKPKADRAETQKEVIACYQSFIRGLLDLTDNIVDHQTVPPKNVICHDTADPYLVVAADKGTATFSDIANAISAEYNFWLGDAFASGGSAGYDHKKMGITAKGAWESVKRHFRELEIDISKQSFTVIGIGDMSGDVFGNGMLYTNNIKLIAAFDHRDIFIDPDPDAEKTFTERKRLFDLPNSSWQDFDKKYISKGGGVFSRSLKSIALTSEIKKALDISDNALAPNDLIRAILKAPVDLLFNGGIGTYVKAIQESHADVGDRTNDFCRIDGSELRCKIVGEGGNLGFTQLGRIEYALNNGLINTDFIDNSAGVDCSDHEVNIKILLSHAIASHQMTMKQRNQLLAKMTDTVGEYVLKDNEDQALAMSVSAQHSTQYMGLYQTQIKQLELHAGLDRAVEFLPDDKKLAERKSNGIGLTRPELAVLLAWTKIYIKNELLQSDLPDDPWFKTILQNYFPPKLIAQHQDALKHHRLSREIIATQLSNHLVNSMGITFVYRLQSETGRSVADVIRAYMLAARVYEVDVLQKAVLQLGFKITTKMQFELLHHIRQLLNLATRWFLRGNRLHRAMGDTIKLHAPAVKRLEKIVPHLMTGKTKVYMDKMVEQFVKDGLPKDIAIQISICRAMYTALNITEVAHHHHFDLTDTANVYFDVGTQLNLVWFRDQIASDSREGHWNNLARLALREELDALQRKLTVVILKDNKNKKLKSESTVVTDWVAGHQDLYAHWNKMLETLVTADHVEYTLFFVALRELADLITVSETM
ncbi:MAG: NAD-glutamate dehydrogenase [Gammaproteobacteria bacterium]|nr:NAD-glutamate dehydrogenase [Gammaproteobacteria bacterium]